MHIYSDDDTIAAIATPVGESGIGIVRISGRAALTIAEKVFHGKKDGKVSGFSSHTLHYGWIVEDPARFKGGLPAEFVDEVILTVMRAPRSYTREDSVEINCHGGIIALRNVLDLLLRKGCRLAEPGEFTRRAFLNGRIDLTQSEAVLGIIRAKTDAALKAGTRQLGGALSRHLHSVRRVLIGILADLEAHIDFPDEDIGTFSAQKAKAVLGAADEQIRRLCDALARGKILREGVRVAICGKPNVGKSSFLNALLNEERSIVTPVAGTTRDTIEEVIDIKGIPVRIADTAGIIEPRNLIERKAVSRSRQYIDEADIVLLIFDASRNLSPQDKVLMKVLRRKNVIAVINKIDLKQRLSRKSILRQFGGVIEISAKKRSNIRGIEDAFLQRVYKGSLSTGEEALTVSLRHQERLKKAQKLIAEARKSVDNDLSNTEFVAQDIRDALQCLDELLGKRFSEDLLERIFKDFCVGK